MKKLLASLLSVCLWAAIFSFWPAVSAQTTTNPSVSTRYNVPSVQEGYAWVKNWTEKQGYHVVAARNILAAAYANTSAWTPSEREYIAKLLTEVELEGELNYRKSVRFELNGSKTVANMYGQIDSNIDDSVNELLQLAPNLQQINMIYVPGSYDDESNHRAWRVLNAKWVTIKIPHYGFIASGGVDFLMAWKKTIVERGAQIGVHAWMSDTYPTPWLLPQNDPAHSEYVDFWTEMGISTDLYRWALQNTKPGSIHWLTEEEINRYGFRNKSA